MLGYGAGQGDMLGYGARAKAACRAIGPGERLHVGL